MMDKLKMMSMDKTQENIEKIKALFPNCVTEVKRDGKVELAVDFDMLKQEMSDIVIDDTEERYQFTWPDKKKSVLLANAPINATLRPIVNDEKIPTGKDSNGNSYISTGSVGKNGKIGGFDSKNLYIEGDNLDVLKLMQETYLGKIKMIYIDPPYNTGNDFVYEDDFKQNADEYLENSGQFDEEGNRLVKNIESNGRFHTDWLNMIYPRLKVAKNLLKDDGAILIHIDEHEVYNLQKICNEVFGESNELGTIIWDKRNPKGVVAGVAYQHESIIVYCKNISVFAGVPFLKKKEHAEEMLSKVKTFTAQYGGINENVRNKYKEWLKQNKANLSGGELAYCLIDENGDIYRTVSMAAPDKPETRSHRELIHPKTGRPCPCPAKGWRFTDSTLNEMLKNGKIEFGIDETTVPNQRYYLKDNLFESVSSLLYFGGSDDALGLPFDNPKPVYVAKRLINSLSSKEDIIMDFFSGSATTAHAVMQLNAEDDGKRKFIMVQLPELCNEKSEAYKAGYKNICEIGKERIRRAGKKIKEDIVFPNKEKNGIPLTSHGEVYTREFEGEKTIHYVDQSFLDTETGKRITEKFSPSCDKDKYRFNPDLLDVGFRVLKLDSSNMKNVYYRADEVQQDLFDNLTDNIKEDRTPEDLLFQVMLDMGVDLSSKIETKIIAGKKLFIVGEVIDGVQPDLICCFDANITDEVVTAIAKMKPLYAVFRDSSFATDSVAANFDQIFATYSPTTTRKVI